jgi:hypothetical protein
MESKPARIRYGIGEWYGFRFAELSPEHRHNNAKAALGMQSEVPRCPFQAGSSRCSKAGGVCSIQRFEEAEAGMLGAARGMPVVVCPNRFEEDDLLLRWLGEIVGFSWTDTLFAREVAFMQSSSTGKPAGKIDLVIADSAAKGMQWFGLEIQAVYFSGAAMSSEFESALHHSEKPVFPDKIRRPDWRSSSAKRLMPQLQVKVPTLRRWGSKMAVAVDRPFFNEIGGPSEDPSHDLDDGDIIWLAPELKEDGAGGFNLSAGHWEVLTLEASSEKLLAAKTVSRSSFEESLKEKLVKPVSGP